MILTSKDIERFFSKVAKTDTCWLWQGNLYKNNYGVFYVKSKPERAHRISWLIHNKKEIPIGMEIRHSCNNPQCVNPQHLLLGTHKQNMMDRCFSDKPPFLNGCAKLCVENIKDIRTQWPSRSISSLAKEYNLSETTISNIVHNRSWVEV